MLCLKNEYFLIFQKHTLLVQSICILCLQINAYFFFQKVYIFFHKISTYLTVAKYLRMFVNKISAFYLFEKKCAFLWTKNPVQLNLWATESLEAQYLSAIWRCSLYTAKNLTLYRCWTSHPPPFSQSLK